jgi:hypothetical protein
MVRRLAALMAALGMTLLLSAPAFAVEITQDLPISSDSAEFQGSETECAEADVEAGQVLWHFIINQSSTDDQTITLTFENAGTATYSPDKVVDTFVLHYDVITGSPDTLLSASSSGNDGIFNLSHICDGGPPPEIPEAPASVLLILTAGFAGLAFLGLRYRRSTSVV